VATPWTRRQFLASATLAALGVACTKKLPPAPGTSSPAAGSLSALKSGSTPLSMISPYGDAQTETTWLPTGVNPFTFGLVDDKGNLLAGGSPQVYLAPDETGPVRGPFPAAAFEMTAYQHYQDNDPVGPTAFFGLDLEITDPGTWVVAAVANLSGAKGFGEISMQVVAEASVAAVGSMALSVPTPVGTTEAALSEICTRVPPDHMHYISLDEALGNGLPTVITFGTPLLCESRLCGPVTDEVLAVHDAVGEQAANFIHVEEFLPGPSHTPPPVAAENQSPPFVAWGLDTEPWTFLIDKTGVIQARHLGPIVASQIQTALQPLL
jgi:hypothetical protein